MAEAKARKRKPVVHSHDATTPHAAGAMSDINITPLIDVLLVLLIIFMVVTPVAQRGLDIALPQAAPPSQQKQTSTQQIVLALEETGLSVNKTPIASLEELDNRLKDIFQARTDKTIFVRAAGKVAYGKVVEAMDIARGAGVDRIGIISESMVEDVGGVAQGQ